MVCYPLTCVSTLFIRGIFCTHVYRVLEFCAPYAEFEIQVLELSFFLQLANLRFRSLVWLRNLWLITPRLLELSSEELIGRLRRKNLWRESICLLQLLDVYSITWKWVFTQFIWKMVYSFSLAHWLRRTPRVSCLETWRPWSLTRQIVSWRSVSKRKWRKLSPYCQTVRIAIPLHY